MNIEIIKKFHLTKTDDWHNKMFVFDIPMYKDGKGNRFAMYNFTLDKPSSYISCITAGRKVFKFSEEMALDPYFTDIDMLMDMIEFHTQN